MLTSKAVAKESLLGSDCYLKALLAKCTWLRANNLLLGVARVCVRASVCCTSECLSGIENISWDATNH